MEVDLKEKNISIPPDSNIEGFVIFRLVFSQSLLTLDIIELFLKEQSSEARGDTQPKSTDKNSTLSGDVSEYVVGFAVDGTFNVFFESNRNIGILIIVFLFGYETIIYTVT